MFERHPDPAVLASLGRDQLSREMQREVVRHLLTGCSRCRRVTTRLVPPAVPANPGAPDLGQTEKPVDYSAAFRAAGREVARQAVSFAAEQAVAPELLRELGTHPFDRQWLLVTNHARYQSWALCELLLETSREQGFQDPPRALELAELGAAVAAQLSFATYGGERVADLSARAWAVLANAERIRSDFRAAEKGFARAEKLLRAGTGDPVEKAGVLLLKASLRGNQQRFGEAFRLLDRVVALAHRQGDSHLAGKALITKGFVCSVARRLEESAELLHEGLALVDPSAEPRLLVAARHNLALSLVENGRHEEAFALLQETRPLYDGLGDRMNLTRLRWLEGKIELGRGRSLRAEKLLRQVRTELADEGLGYDAALVSLELARLFAHQGRTGEMRQLSAEMIPIFQSRDIHREAIAALIVFQKAVEREQVTVDLVQQMSEYLLKSRGNSALRVSDAL